MLVVIRGAGDIATGIALRLFRSGIKIVMTDLPQPTSIRRTVLRRKRSRRADGSRCSQTRRQTACVN